MAVETEIKLRMASPAGEILRKLSALGYQAGERTLEVDQLYDRNDSELRNSGRLLRLRTRGSRWTLTYKGPVQADRHKSREELETDLADGTSFVEILVNLGYRPSFRYEKYRTTCSRAGDPGLITIDETPIGVFLELEGAGDWIDRTAALLGYSERDYVTASYSSLYADYRRRNPQVPENMTF